MFAQNLSLTAVEARPLVRWAGCSWLVCDDEQGSPLTLLLNHSRETITFVKGDDPWQYQDLPHCLP
jgi:hypothetical protein